MREVARIESWSAEKSEESYVIIEKLILRFHDEPLHRTGCAFHRLKSSLRSFDQALVEGNRWRTRRDMPRIMAVL